VISLHLSKAQIWNFVREDSMIIMSLTFIVVLATPVYFSLKKMTAHGAVSRSKIRESGPFRCPIYPIVLGVLMLVLKGLIFLMLVWRKGIINRTVSVL